MTLCICCFHLKCQVSCCSWTRLLLTVEGFSAASTGCVISVKWIASWVSAKWICYVCVSEKERECVCVCVCVCVWVYIWVWQGVRNQGPLSVWSEWNAGLVVKVMGPDSTLQLNRQQPFTKEIHTQKHADLTGFLTHSLHAVQPFSECETFLSSCLWPFYRCIFSSNCKFILGSGSLHTQITFPHAQASLHHSECLRCIQLWLCEEVQFCHSSRRGPGIERWES